MRILFAHQAGHLQDSTVKANGDSALPSELPCYWCGYDLRAHPQDGICPECGGSVAESRQWAAIPRRPAWKESDPRWRRRILAGTWVLVLLPLMDVLEKSGWASHLFVPTFWGYGPNSLQETLLFNMALYPIILFCIGVVLLFSKERGRRSSRLDWTRRWGIICSYVVALLSAAFSLFLAALVLAGISMLFLSMPPKYQPSVTGVFVELSTTYLRYGPYPSDIKHGVLVTFSSVTILLACAPLWEALCSTGLKKSLARMILAPLALFALMNIAQASLVVFGFSTSSRFDPVYLLGPYFRPAVLVSSNRFSGYSAPLWNMTDFVVECIKWGIIFLIAVWLSFAQLPTRRKTLADQQKKD
jgi:hypothetical protein